MSVNDSQHVLAMLVILGLVCMAIGLLVNFIAN